MKNVVAEAIANADAHLNNVGLPTYTEAVKTLRLALRAIDSRIITPGTLISDDENDAYLALCKILVPELTEANL
jgi:hypothetical protein